MPLPRTTMIPDSWSAHHQPSVETAMRSRVDILLPVDQIPPPEFGQDPDEVNDTAVTGVRARIRALSTGNDLAASDQSNDHADYLVQLPASALPSMLVGHSGHRLRVVTNPESPGVEGRVFAVMGIQHSTEAFNRDLICREHTTQQQEG